MSKIKISHSEALEIRKRFRYIASASILTIGIGVVMMHYLEGFSYFDALYFSVVSLTTVGYGDYTPQTVGGKIFVMVYLVMGIAIIAALVNNLLRSALARRVLKNEEASNEK